MSIQMIVLSRFFLETCKSIDLGTRKRSEVNRLHTKEYVRCLLLRIFLVVHVYTLELHLILPHPKFRSTRERKSFLVPILGSADMTTVPKDVGSLTDDSGK